MNNTYKLIVLFGRIGNTKADVKYTSELLTEDYEVENAFSEAELECLKLLEENEGKESDTDN